MKKYNGLPKATYYRRLKLWTTTLFDADGNAYHVSPKHMMKRAEEMVLIKKSELDKLTDAHKQTEIE